ncbi:MAG: hypothetical protein CMJ64_19645 [Planctomycetaceae bacterium]|nr:hypothetical protein [Planctomycetaceae bacterium]
MRVCLNGRTGLVLGIGAEWLCAWEEGYSESDNRVLNPEQDKRSAANLVADWHQMTGPSVTVAAACASANVALAQAKRWIEMGWIEVCLVGACEIVTPLLMGGFDKLRALSRNFDNPTVASRPFDRSRDRFVMAEGGAFFVLESSDHARRRSARAYAEVAGYGASSDAFHIVAPSTEHQHAALAVQHALDDAQINPEDIDYVNAHATSTPIGDSSEANTLRRAFGPAIEKIPVSSTKA